MANVTQVVTNAIPNLVNTTLTAGTTVLSVTINQAGQIFNATGALIGNIAKESLKTINATAGLIADVGGNVINTSQDTIGHLTQAATTLFKGFFDIAGGIINGAAQLAGNLAKTFFEFIRLFGR